VNLPAIRPVHPFSSVTTALIQAGGVKTTGSLRDIQVIRNDKIVSHFDLYEFLTAGNSVQDIQLRDRDVIFVPVRKSTVQVEGAVHRPSIYEAQTGETVFDIISFSGLTTAQASDKLELNRIVPLNRRSSADNATENIYATLTSSRNIPARDGDLITIREILPQINQVYIYGKVKFPGEYAYEDSLCLIDLLRLAGGIDDENFWQTVYKERAEIIRRDTNSDYPRVIEINLRELKAGDQTQNIKLENWDQVLIRENPKYDPPQNVTVLGEVNVPGVYTISHDEETLEDLFARIGGFDAKAFEVGIKMYRQNQRVILNDYSINIQDGDSIFVPQRPGVVTVLGEVYTPGYIHHSTKLKLKDYIESAGGFNLYADRHNISVEYANGDVKLDGFWGTPKIDEGAIIRVHTKEAEEPFDTTEFLKETASILASLATIAFIVSRP
jgi:protein involved in polysaccharide export with SLBB domain